MIDNPALFWTIVAAIFTVLSFFLTLYLARSELTNRFLISVVFGAVFGAVVGAVNGLLFGALASIIVGQSLLLIYLVAFALGEASKMSFGRLLTKPFQFDGIGASIVRGGIKGLIFGVVAGAILWGFSGALVFGIGASISFGLAAVPYNISIPNVQHFLGS